MAVTWIAWAACLLALLFGTRAQVHIVAPKWLVQEFKETNSTIEGSTASFGTPFYGDRVLGALQYGESMMGRNHCREDDYSVPQGSGQLVNIIMVIRGGCPFTTKVKIAQKKGAHAVIIVDKKLLAPDLRSTIVADDGQGGDIRIPSVLISHAQGKALIDATKIRPREEVIVELAWTAPAGRTVQTDLWMSSASQESQKFIQNFAKKRRALGGLISFTPHYNVFIGCAPARCGDFGAEDPDGPGPLTGKDVLNEDVRQLCIHELYKVSRKSADKTLYSEEFWNYIERFPDKCPLDKFGLQCSQELMHEVHIDSAKVDECARIRGHELLQHEAERPAWSPNALRINGWRFSGTMDADLATRAICSGFLELPRECKDLLGPWDPTRPPRDPTQPPWDPPPPWDPTQPYIGDLIKPRDPTRPHSSNQQRQSSASAALIDPIKKPHSGDQRRQSVASGWLIGGLLVTAVLGCLLGWLLGLLLGWFVGGVWGRGGRLGKRYLETEQLRAALRDREEVMLEEQIGDYAQMQERCTECPI